MRVPHPSIETEWTTDCQCGWKPHGLHCIHNRMMILCTLRQHAKERCAFHDGFPRRSFSDWPCTLLTCLMFLDRYVGLTLANTPYNCPYVPQSAHYFYPMQSGGGCRGLLGGTTLDEPVLCPRSDNKRGYWILTTTLYGKSRE